MSTFLAMQWFELVVAAGASVGTMALIGLAALVALVWLGGSRRGERP